MKLLFAILLQKYVFKLAPGTKPKELRIGTMAIPDTSLQVLFKAVAHSDTADTAKV